MMPAAAGQIFWTNTSASLLAASVLDKKMVAGQQLQGRPQAMGT